MPKDGQKKSDAQVIAEAIESLALATRRISHGGVEGPAGIEGLAMFLRDEIRPGLDGIATGLDAVAAALDNIAEAIRESKPK